MPSPPLAHSAATRRSGSPAGAFRPVAADTTACERQRRCSRPWAPRSSLPRRYTTWRACRTPFAAPRDTVRDPSALTTHSFDADQGPCTGTAYHQACGVRQRTDRLGTSQGEFYGNEFQMVWKVRGWCARRGHGYLGWLCSTRTDEAGRDGAKDRDRQHSLGPRCHCVAVRTAGGRRRGFSNEASRLRENLSKEPEPSGFGKALRHPGANISTSC